MKEITGIFSLCACQVGHAPHTALNMDPHDSRVILRSLHPGFCCTILHLKRCRKKGTSYLSLTWLSLPFPVPWFSSPHAITSLPGPLTNETEAQLCYLSSRGQGEGTGRQCSSPRHDYHKPNGGHSRAVVRQPCVLALLWLYHSALRGTCLSAPHSCLKSFPWKTCPGSRCWSQWLVNNLFSGDWIIEEAWSGCLCNSSRPQSLNCAG